MTLSIFRQRIHAILPIFALILAAGCASSSPAPATEAPSVEPMTPSLIVIDASGLERRAISGDTGKILEPAVSFGGLYQPALTDRSAVISLKSGDVTRLGLVTTDGAFEAIHEADGQVEYTIAWSPEGDLAFGFHGTSNGIGIFTAEGILLDVGCSASNRVLSWAGDDRLVVAAAANHYLVRTDGCATLKRVDARKMHEVAFSPTGEVAAYIQRELEYDRNARQYVPDSSLWIAGVDGSDAGMIIGDRYKPHRPTWSPDGSELAFDARLPDQPNRRLISIYDVEQAASAFLNPSSVEAPVNEWDAHWSPTGVNLAYRQKFDDGEPGILVRPMNGAFTSLVGESGDRFVRWIDDNHLVLSNGTVERIVSVDGSELFRATPGAAIIGLH